MTLLHEELEHVLVLVEGEVVAAEAGLEHGAGWRRGRASRRRRRRARARSAGWPSPCGAGSRGSRRARCPPRPGRRAAGRPGSPRGTTAPGRRTWARCSCRRWRGCRRRCAASGRCSRRRRTAPGSRMMVLSSSSTVSAASSRRSRVRRRWARLPARPGRCRSARRVLAVELQVVADRRADVVGRQRVLAGPAAGGCGPSGPRGARRRRPPRPSPAARAASGLVERGQARSAISSLQTASSPRGDGSVDAAASACAAGRQPAASRASEHLVRAPRPVALVAHRRQGVGREVGLEARPGPG